MNSNNQPFVQEPYYAIALDPIHVGAGGYRLGRVDNTLVREAGTNLPKIPGSGISGVTRAYTALALQSNDPNNKKYIDGKKSCAGKGAEDGEGHCGKNDCPVCVSFGFSKKEQSFQGLVQFCDAHIVLFPVFSMKGTVWITCEEALLHAGVTLNGSNIPLEKEKIIVSPLLNNDLDILNDLGILNVGWLMLQIEKKKIAPNIYNELRARKISDDILDRIAIVHNDIFSRIVNDNLEVRTSVAIDPTTGAAEDGALYTYEAIPRATVFCFDIVYNKPEFYRIGDKEIVHKQEGNGNGYKWLKENVEKGLFLMEYLGIGGMNTRGFGRLRILNLEKGK
ncbi:MAG: type III-B CRISPR module RAMP protein Cmr4 [Bacteroidota bacterium]